MMVNIFIFHAVFVFDTVVCVFDAVVMCPCHGCPCCCCCCCCLHPVFAFAVVTFEVIILSVLRCADGVKKCTCMCGVQGVQGWRGSPSSFEKIIVNHLKMVDMLKIEKMMMVLLEMVTWPPLDRRPP